MAVNLASPNGISAGTLAGAGRLRFMGTPFDPISHEAVLRMLAASNEECGFRYIVTPNVDHAVRLSRNPDLTPFYADAWLSLCDSKPISLMARLLAVKLPLVTGSDLTITLFRQVVRPGDVVSLIAADAGIVAGMERAFPHLEFRAHVPPIGIWNDPAALQACVDFLATEPARFALIAVGSPQSEKIAYLAAQQGRAQGIGLCIGAGLEFLTGAKKRAPSWMRAMSIEWLHRLASDPRRLWRRYASAVLPLLRLFAKEAAGGGRVSGAPVAARLAGRAEHPASGRVMR